MKTMYCLLTLCLIQPAFACGGKPAASPSVASGAPGPSSTANAKTAPASSPSSTGGGLAGLNASLSRLRELKAIGGVADAMAPLNLEGVAKLADLPAPLARLDPIAQAQDRQSHAGEEARIREFEERHAITAWPGLEVCGYDRPLGGLVFGTVLDVHTHGGTGRTEIGATSALDYSRYKCHGNLGHHLEGWPKDLPNGRYVVAVSAKESDQAFSARPWMLKVHGVLETSGNAALIEAARRRTGGSAGNAESSLPKAR